MIPRLGTAKPPVNGAAHRLRSDLSAESAKKTAYFGPEKRQVPKP